MTSRKQQSNNSKPATGDHPDALAVAGVNGVMPARSHGRSMREIFAPPATNLRQGITHAEQAAVPCPACGSVKTWFLTGMVQVRCFACNNVFVRADLDAP